MNELDFLRFPVWYPELAVHTFLTYFVKLEPEAVELLAKGSLDDPEKEKKISRKVIEALRQPLSEIPGNAFISVDSCSPTDTERFALKHGAVYSAKSVWDILRSSEKVRAAAGAGKVTSICLRPYRRITPAREFRLFIRNGKVVAASQYHLVRHFRRLEGVREQLWLRFCTFINSISWRLPKEPFVMDVYLTAGYERIMVLDLNPWGDPTDPLLLNSWERNWDEPVKLLLMEPPTSISGNVDVSF